MLCNVVSRLCSVPQDARFQRVPSRYSWSIPAITPNGRAAALPRCRPRHMKPRSPDLSSSRTGAPGSRWEKLNPPRLLAVSGDGGKRGVVGETEKRRVRPLSYNNHGVKRSTVDRTPAHEHYKRPGRTGYEGHFGRAPLQPRRPFKLVRIVGATDLLSAGLPCDRWRRPRRAIGSAFRGGHHNTMCHS